MKEVDEVGLQAKNIILPLATHYVLLPYLLPCPSQIKLEEKIIESQHRKNKETLKKKRSKIWKWESERNVLSDNQQHKRRNKIKETQKKLKSLTSYLNVSTGIYQLEKGERRAYNCYEMLMIFYNLMYNNINYPL